MYKKKNLYLIIISLFILFSSLPVYTMEFEESLPPGIDEYDVRILHNGNYLNTNLKPKELDKRTILAPIRPIMEDLGYKLTWENGIVSVKKDGSKNIILDSQKTDYKLKNESGNIYVELNFFEQFEDFNLAYDMPTKTITIASDDLKDGDIYHYDLGDRTIKTKLDRDLTYRLNGGITVPESKNNPIVFIMHGSHHINEAKNNRYDLGFSYLMKELKKQGYAVISLNVGIQYSFEDGEPMASERIDHIFEETLRELREANKGKDTRFDLDLKDKLDFKNTIMIGHSRSGQEIFRFANEYKDDDRLDIKGLLSLAPSRIYVMDYNIRDIPTAIILPELDGDVTALDGQWIFDELITSKDRQSEAQAVFLYGANHNSMNQAILNQDEGKTWYTGELEKIPAEKERQFIIDYTTEFLNMVTKNQSLKDKLVPQGESLLGYQALVSSYIPGETVYMAEDELNKVTSNEVEVKPVLSSYIPQKNTAGLFYHPGDREELPLLNIRWKNKGGHIDFDIPKNIEAKDTLSIYMAQDSTDPINNGENQSFTITLIDEDKKEESMVLDKNTPALKHHDGETIFEDTVYSSHTPLSLLNIPLDRFDGIDKNRIKKIRFNFTENNQGSIMLRFIEMN